MGCNTSKNVDSKASRAARWRSTGIVGLRDSKLKTFPDEVLDLDRSIRTLDLTHNKIVDIPVEISKLANLQRLLLAHNLIDRLPINLAKLVSLKVMTLDGNRVTTLPDELGQLVRLEQLSISGNSLESLPETIGSLRNLKLLNLSKNKLKSLPESIGSCFSLEELQANDNSIEELPESVCNLIHVKSLCLDNNNVKQIPTNLLKDCKALQNISLHGNPISMDQFQQFNMVQKRSLDDEEIFVSFKHPRQVGHNKELVSFSESVFPGDVSEEPETLENGCAKDNNRSEEEISDDKCSGLPKGGEDVETSAPRSFTISSWTTSSNSGEDPLFEASFHGSFFPEYFNHERSIRTLTQFEDIYSVLLDHPPRKSASIGPEHQADVPLWGAQGAHNNFDLEDEKRLMGTCVIPMPDSDTELFTDTGCIVGKGRIDCSCEDGESVRCVRQHILEAREKLVKTIGPKRFEELGFNDMGEQVAQTWSEEEEQLFHRVVFSNPTSLGKNFWDKLSTVFPSRTKKEIVSYYFNVFMLRKRAEQNRYDPMNIDSDSDEWQGSNDYGDNQPSVTEDEDSVVESPEGRRVPGYNRNWKDDLEVLDEDDTDETCDENVDVDMFGRGPEQILDRCYGLVDNCSSCPIAQLQDKISWDEKGDQEVQDDSCTSFDAAVAASQESQRKSENGNHWSSSFNRGDHEFVLEPCDAKIWDAGYMTCPKNKVDFLPTSNMIEEVFGKESWNYKARDGKNLG
ncbi:unnamed protein product [Malus baccata var. baccata]